jgi:hypothetical protein
MCYAGSYILYALQAVILGLARRMLWSGRPQPGYGLYRLQSWL